jgi:diamine N-acetyltransferase
MPTIRKASIKDIDAFVEFRKESHQESEYVNTISKTKATVLLTTAINDPNQPVYFAIEFNEIVGQLFLKLNKTDNICHILLISVLARFQGSGLSFQLIKTTEKEANENKCRYIELIVNTENERAINFYKKNGFIVVGSYDKRNIKFQKDLANKHSIESFPLSAGW